MVSFGHRQRKPNTCPEKVNTECKNRPVLLLSGHSLEMFRDDQQSKPEYVLQWLLKLVGFSMMQMYTGPEFMKILPLVSSLECSDTQKVTIHFKCFHLSQNWKCVPRELIQHRAFWYLCFFININNLPPSMTIVQQNKLMCYVHTLILLEARGKAEAKYFSERLVWAILNGRLIQEQALHFLLIYPA